jgi:outer membrane lipoprotein-sorting protein
MKKNFLLRGNYKNPMCYLASTRPLNPPHGDFRIGGFRRRELNFFNYLLVMLLVLFCFDVSAAEPAIMSKIRQKYNEKTTIRAQFDLDIFWSVREKSDHKTGSLIIAPQNRFKVEINGELFVSNGDKFWHYTKSPSQVVIENVAKIDLSSLPSNLLQKFLFNYTYIELQKNASETVLEWKKDPADSSIYTSIKIWASSAGAVTKLQITDRNSNINTYTFHKTIFGGQVPTGTFDFQVPKNAQVLNNYE